MAVNHGCHESLCDALVHGIPVARDVFTGLIVVDVIEMEHDFDEVGPARSALRVIGYAVFGVGDCAADFVEDSLAGVGDEDAGFGAAVGLGHFLRWVG